MLRKAMLVAAAVLVPAALLASGPVSADKPVKAHIQLGTDVKVGGTQLKAGDYNIVVDASSVTFQRLEPGLDAGDFVNAGKPVVVPCTKKTLPQKNSHTELTVPSDPSGQHVLKQVTLGGTDIELDFN
jgi:hypothetical protein